MNRIQVLPDYIAHKIAAGEVIERPVSVVKELVENSIDAMATSIEVEIMDGGKEYIRVSDNGTGIYRDDLKLAFLPHATSKIRTVDDLFNITSLGFRGEALASIASVSNLILRSRTTDTLQGYQISFSEDNQAVIEPVGMDKGTTVEVRRLFYNTPARYKFLRQSATERRYIVEFVSRIAVAHPHIAFKLIADGKLAVRTHGQGELKEALANILDHRTVKDLVPIDTKTEWGGISGYLSKPRLTRKSRQGQLIILNGRIIESSLISSAVERAYAGMLASKQYPIFFLILTMDPKIVDVNVHPAKSQVRFQDDSQLYQEISSACREILLESDLTHKLTSVRTTDSVPERSEPQQVNLEFEQYFPWQPLTWSKVDAFLQKEKRMSAPSPSFDYRDEASAVEVQPAVEVELEAAEDNKVAEPKTNIYQIKDQLLNGRIIGQFRQTYILLETTNGLWLLDQHIIHERIIYEQILNREQAAFVQQTIPQTLHFSSAEAGLVSEQLDKLRDLGVELEEFGTNSFLLRGIPQYFAARDIIVDEQLILELVNDLSQQKNWREKAAVTLACRSAVKAGQRLNERQIHALLAQLAETENPFTCPHGRPIIVRIEDKEIERRFGR
ncbi:MAG: DNA mismatch repair endonuclease MutL [Firmicutes bacterium]|jgi:DNA mismatch repair protein MutL|nr:DNA mismatch repair endonuclease MutL [Bacillota bacterium]